MIRPTEEPYGVKHYLADAARAFWRKVRYEHHNYFPPYHGIKVGWSWGREIERLFNIALVCGVLWWIFG